MNRTFYATRVLLAGLSIAQMIATLHVYLSDIRLYETTAALKSAGYLIVPNSQTLETLFDFFPAFCGGLFFTLSVGAGLTLVSFGAAWSWDRLFQRGKWSAGVYGALWLALMLQVNRKGLQPLISAYFVLIPAAVAGLTLRWIPAGKSPTPAFKKLSPVLPLFLLAVLWASQMDSGLFINLRDNFLLSNSTGLKINDFYYKYTLHPAETFKALNQKILKSSSLAGMHAGPLREALKQKLLDYDYLTIDTDVPVDLRITVADQGLILAAEDRKILTTTANAFLADPQALLEEFALKSDRHAFWRQFTFLALLIGFPVMLYMLWHAFFKRLAMFFFKPDISQAAASGLCLITGIAMLAYLHLGRGQALETEHPEAALSSADWRLRVAALKLLPRKGLDVSDYPAYSAMLKSPHIAERYYLVRALGVSRRAQTYRDLLAFLDDPHPNVVCMAFFALGQRGNRRAIDAIIQKLETSGHWYEQWYGYKALRILGWKQTGSN